MIKFFQKKDCALKNIVFVIFVRPLGPCIVIQKTLFNTSLAGSLCSQCFHYRIFWRYTLYFKLQTAFYVLLTQSFLCV